MLIESREYGSQNREETLKTAVAICDVAGDILEADISDIKQLRKTQSR